MTAKRSSTAHTRADAAWAANHTEVFRRRAYEDQDVARCRRSFIERTVDEHAG